MKKKPLSPTILLSSIIPTPGTVNNAEGRPTQVRIDGNGPFGYLERLWDQFAALISLIGILAIIMIVITAIRYAYASANGDSKQSELTKRALIQVVLGVALFVGAFAAVAILMSAVRWLASIFS